MARKAGQDSVSIMDKGSRNNRNGIAMVRDADTIVTENVSLRGAQSFVFSCKTLTNISV